jgi:spermidine dehydrogenase
LHTPNELILVCVRRTSANQVCPAREEQGAANHYELLATPFVTFERNTRTNWSAWEAAAGFDPARDMEAITVNRWPHGYAYEYNPLDPQWPEGKHLCNIALRRFGRITIANSDAAAAAYTDHAIGQ